ncbi:hypothetical protein ABI59_06760 [Acidobacteria bacterium Mor1]|nr:hypothetical protein ABI59_06760 [Acidobacteria bacterium Mor1]
MTDKQLLERLNLLQGDITTLGVDAVVNAANSALSGGGGVDGAIHRAAGPQLLDACRTLGRCPPGEAVVTDGFQLPARWVIHSVGPVWYGGSRNETGLLFRTYSSAMARAREIEARSIAFPAISCGAYRFPVSLAAEIALAALIEELRNHPVPESITLCNYNPAVHRAYQKALAAHQESK